MDATSRFALLSADDVGISEYSNSELTGTGGLIKVHPEDFRVNEIRQRDGRIMVALADEHRLGSSTYGEESDDLLSTAGSSSFEPELERCVGKTVRFVLSKRGSDTLEAIDALSQLTQMPSRMFFFAGIKDSRAVTCQEVCIAQPCDRFFLSQLQKARVEIPGLSVDTIEPFDMNSDLLHPGKLRGNHFRIFLRDPKCSKSEVEVAMQSLKDRGFINYVGLQRFGKGGMRSDPLGLHYLRRDYVACIDCLLSQPDSKETRGQAKARWVETWRRTNSPSLTLKLLPPSAWVERKVLGTLNEALQNGIQTWEESCREAFLKLPKNIRLLFVHSYFDRLWNLVVSERVRCSKNIELQEGDCVMIEKDCSADVVGERRSVEKSAHKVTASDVLAQRFSPFDLVLPRPGVAVSLDDCTQWGRLMRTYLSYDEVEDFSVELNLEGALWEIQGDYRRVLGRPRNLTLGEQPEEELECLSWEEVVPKFKRRRLEGGGNDGVWVNFSLGAGQYATMALRELMAEGRTVRLEAAEKHVFFSDSDSDAP